MKKNAFTLIELLAVIVILAIIALIAVPIVLGIINDSKISSEKENINLYKSAVNNAIARKQLSEISFNPDTCNVKDNGDLECFVNNKAIGIIKVEMSGQLPNDGIIRFENNKISEIEDLKIKENYYNLLTSGRIIIGKKPTDPGLYDEDYNLIASWDELVAYGLDVESEHIFPDSRNSRLENILWNNDKLLKGKILIIDNSITKIGGYIFYDCNNLENIILSNNVLSIGEAAFSNCSNLKKILIPNKVSNIHRNAFINCTSLKNITIPSSVTTIENNVFGYCSNLEKIKVDPANAVYEDRNSNAIIERETNRLIIGCKNTIIPSSVTTIGEYAFAYNNGLKSIIIPNGVTKIETYAFYNCLSLTNITISSTVTFIGDYVFYYCTNLKSAIFENTSGWFTASSSTATSGTNMTVTNPSTNATNLKITYKNKYWKRN